MANRLVDDDARQPCCKARVRTEFREMPKRAQIGLLHHVLGLSVIPDDRPCDPVEPLIVTPNDQAQRGRTPLPRETHEFGIDQSGQLQLGGGLLRHVALDRGTEKKVPGIMPHERGAAAGLG